MYLNNNIVTYNVNAEWSFGDKVTVNSEDKSIKGKQIGSQSYTCSYAFRNVKLEDNGSIDIDDLKLSFSRESHWDEDSREYIGQDWSIDCNSSYRLINVEVAICGWDRNNEDAEFSYVFFSSTNAQAIKYGWKNVQTSQLSTFVPTQWVDEENDVEESRAEVISMKLTPYFRVYVTYRRNTDPSGSYRYAEMIYDTWPN